VQRNPSINAIAILSQRLLTPEMAPTDWRVKIPESSVSVEVSVIDTTTYLRESSGSMILKPIYPGYEKCDAPSYSFLIHHRASNSRLLFDLGLRKNWRTHLSPHLLHEIESFGLTIQVEKDVAEILQENGLQPGDISTIVLSHHHWDHVGDITLFPASTTLVVGPGYKNTYLPGWPTNPEAAATTTDLYEGREVIELDFSSNHPNAFKIGSYPAYDWFGDASFYILSTPGHTKSHLCCLARTTVTNLGSTFIFLGGDIAHHCSLLRPSGYCPLPDKISPPPYDKPMSNSSCSSKLYTSIHRAYKDPNGGNTSRITPFCLVPGGYIDDDPQETQATVNRMMSFDGDENIFTILAHDSSLLDVIEFFPKKATDWKAKLWDKRGHWRFLGPLEISK
jgi:glyoxylase-like metal-dependent hydrolase (beta-lactamase superfamily II)